MKKFYCVFSYVCLIVLSNSVYAQGTSMTESEFNQLLSGNTLRGVWANNNYQQYFDPNGDTIYQEEGKPETSGTWRINAQAQFCSIWPPSTDEYCYNVVKDSEILLWDDGQGNIYPANVETGKTF